MKINPTNSDLVQNHETASRAKSGVRTPKADSGDFAISLAGAVREAKKSDGMNAPERSARVKEPKQQVQAGMYRVDAESIAEKMVSSLLFDEKA